MATPLTRAEWLDECAKLAKTYEEAMTDEAKALVERLRGDWPEILVEKHWMMDSDAIDKQREEAADLIETQAREIERLREALQGISDFGGRHTGHGYSCHLLARAALAGDSHD